MIKFLLTFYIVVDVFSVVCRMRYDAIPGEDWEHG